MDMLVQTGAPSAIVVAVAAVLGVVADAKIGSAAGLGLVVRVLAAAFVGPATTAAAAAVVAVEEELGGTAEALGAVVRNVAPAP
jgi:hypothetical protein